MFSQLTSEMSRPAGIVSRLSKAKLSIILQFKGSTYFHTGGYPHLQMIVGVVCFLSSSFMHIVNFYLYLPSLCIFSIFYLVLLHMQNTLDQPLITGIAQDKACFKMSIYAIYLVQKKQKKEVFTYNSK